MKFLQIHGFYPEYLDRFYSKNPLLSQQSFDRQLHELLEDGFSGSHLFAPYMTPYGYESVLIIANCYPAQQAWCLEHGIALPTTLSLYETTLQQVEYYKPDILYLSDPINFDARFISQLRHKPKFILGWRAATIPEGTNWQGFDLILSNFNIGLDAAQKLGARDKLFFMPGFPTHIARKLAHEQPDVDIGFSGQLSGEHTQRLHVLNHVSQGLLSEEGNYSIEYHILGDNLVLPAGIAMHNHGSLWGLEMFRFLRKSRISLNVQIDIGGNQAGNMRLFECTGVGGFLLTDHHPNISQYFEPGREIETYRTTSELMEKITYYLENPKEREVIAQRGQQRCLANYSMELRAEELDDIIRQHMGLHKGTIEPVMPETDLYDVAYQWGWNQPELRQLVYLCYKTPDLLDNARRFSMSEGFKETVSLFCGMGKPPRKDIKVLDLGCGNGVATYALSRCGYDVTGVDSSLGELAGLKAAAKLNGLDGAEFSLFLSTGESLEFRDENFDIVWMREVLHHIHDLQRFMKEVARILKPGGIICCLREHVIWNESQRDHFFRTHPFYHITKDEGCYYLDEYVSAFKEANLSVETLLGPTDSVINTYPAPWRPGLMFDPNAAKLRPEGNDLFSFFARKTVSPATPERGNGKPIDTGNSVILESFNIQVREAHDGRTYLKTGNDCMIGAHFQVVSPDARIIIGDRVYISAGTRLICGDMIEFGNDILVAWGCTFIDHDSYPMDAQSRKTMVLAKLERLRRGDPDWDKPELACVKKGKISIGDNVWIGMNSVILQGVTIGEGAVVGACSVVKDDVEPWTVVIGNPARRII